MAPAWNPKFPDSRQILLGACLARFWASKCFPMILSALAANQWMSLFDGGRGDACLLDGISNGELVRKRMASGLRLG